MWARQLAAALELPYYQFLPEILAYYFADLPKPVTVVGVNDGKLLPAVSDASIRITNLSKLPKSEYEALIFSADLMLTENKMSISMGKAICGYVPCAILHNNYRYRELRRQPESNIRNLVNDMEFMRPGAIYPYGVFPSGKDEYEQIGLYSGSALKDGFVELEVYCAEELYLSSLTR